MASFLQHGALQPDGIGKVSIYTVTVWIPSLPDKREEQLFFYMVYKLCKSRGKPTDSRVSPCSSTSHVMKATVTSDKGEQCFCSAVSEVSYPVVCIL